MANAGRRLPAGRIGRVIEIIERLEMDNAGSPLGVHGSTLE
jgi:hypothetical protein